jgi:hypothetical protein
VETSRTLSAGSNLFGWFYIRLPLSPIYTHRLYLWAALDVRTSRDVVLHFGPTIFIKITRDSILGADLY